MSLHLLIHLPEDRTRAGTLGLYRVADGRRLFDCPCLGRSAGALPRRDHDPLVHRGDTPTGEYASTFVTRLPKSVLGIGMLWIGLDPVGGQALAAERTGRRGLGIHGGRGDAALKPTHGCIRLRDADMATLAAIAGKSRFTVEITGPQA